MHASKEMYGNEVLCLRFNWIRFYMFKITEHAKFIAFP